MRVGLYLRVSTADQNQELQLRELQKYATGISGKSLRSTRTPSADPQQADQG
jgi:DNA invertase Pin-like site-specific DNA recombinase